MSGVLEEIASTIREKYPLLNVNYVPRNGSAWVVIHQSQMAITSPDHPPTYDPFMVLTLVDGCVTFDFKVFNQSVQNGTFSWDKVEILLNTLLPYSGYVLCPGLKEYPAAVHFESKHYVHISCPHERHQSNCCALWHVPKNRQQLTGSVLYNVCGPCKILDNQLEIVRKRHEKFSTNKRQSWKLPSSKRPLKYCSPLTGT